MALFSSHRVAPPVRRRKRTPSMWMLKFLTKRSKRASQLINYNSDIPERIHTCTRADLFWNSLTVCQLSNLLATENPSKWSKLCHFSSKLWFCLFCLKWKIHKDAKFKLINIVSRKYGTAEFHMKTPRVSLDERQSYIFSVIRHIINLKGLNPINSSLDPLLQHITVHCDTTQLS